MRSNEIELPSRQVAKINANYCNLQSLKKGKGTFVDLSLTAKRELTETFTSQNDDSMICYFLHDSHDGEYAATKMAQDISTSDFSIKEIDVQSSHPCPWIKKKSIINAAKTFNNWKRRSIAEESPAEFAFTTVIAIFSLVVTVLELTPLKEHLPNIINSFIIPILILAILGLFALIFHMGRRHNKLKEASYSELLEKISDFDDNSFELFADYFSAEDYELSKVSFTHRKEYFLVNNLKMLSPRHQYLLNKYLDNIPQKQFWFIFSEYDSNYERFVSHKRLNTTKKEFYIKSVSRNQKWEFANSLGLSPNLLNNPAFKMLGVDYIVEYYMGKVSAELLAIYDRVNTFSRQWRAENFQINITTLVYFIADLFCNYLGEMRGTAWENLFRYRPDAVTTIDKIENNLSTDLFYLSSSNKDTQGQLPKLVTLIMNNFQEDFSDIYACSRLKQEVIIDSKYQQLILIKAIKGNTVNLEDRCIAVNNQLYDIITAGQNSNDINWGNAFHNIGWINVIIYTLDFSERSGIYFYMPFLIHNIIKIYEDALPSEINKVKLFSAKPVLQAARTCVLLEPDDEFDSIDDHYAITLRAAKEVKSDNSGSRKGKVPVSFGLLNMTDVQREEYYGNLLVLREQMIIKYYDLLYDLFCALDNDIFGNNVRLMSQEVANNDLYEKYSRKTEGIALELSVASKYIVAIVQELLLLISSQYALSHNVARIISKLNETIELSDKTKQTLAILLTATECDAFGSATLIFASALLSHQLASVDVAQKTYLGISSKLLRLVFLLKTCEGSFVDDDTKYLCDVLTNYQEPSDSIIGCLLAVHTFLMPRLIREQITNYLCRHNEKISNLLTQMPSQLKADKIETFIHAVSSLKKECLAEEDYKKILQSIHEHVNKHLTKSPVCTLVNEFIPILLYDQISISVESMDTDEIIDNMLSAYSCQTVQLLYSAYIRLEPDRFLEKCPVIASKLLESSYATKAVPILMYLEKASADARNSEAYFSTKKMLCDHIVKESSNSIYILSEYIRFVILCNAEDNVSWFDNVNDLLLKLLLRKEKLLLIESQSYFRARVLGRYGILMYLCFVITTDFRPKVASINYNQMTQDEKLDYIIENFDSLKPTVGDAHHIAYNQVYIDALEAIIANTREIQKVFCNKEVQLLLRFANDTLAVMDLIFMLEPDMKQQVCEMINEYIKSLQRKQDLHPRT